MLKKLKLVAIVALAVPILAVGLYRISVSAQDPTKVVPGGAVAQKIEKITHKQYGQVITKGKENFNGKIRTISEDNKFRYKLYESNGKFASIEAKNLDDFKTDENISKDELINKASTYVQDYMPASQNCTYTLESFTDANKRQDNCNNLIFDEVASNGVKTGTLISISVSKTGDFAGLATFIGNPEIALSTKPSLSKEDALKVATDFIKSQDYLKNVKEIPAAKQELTVRQDKLVWHIEITDIKGTGTTNGFTFYIDASNGNIIFKDRYSALQ
jgi:predicted small secreted protein